MACMYTITAAMVALVIVISSMAIAMPLYISSRLSPPPATSIPMASLDGAMAFDGVMDVIKSDDTNDTVYDERYYNCMDFSWDTMRSLNAQGVEARILVITYSNGSKHAVVIIPTSDKGWVVVEPQSDEVIDPEVGKVDIMMLFPMLLPYSIPVLSEVVSKVEVLDYNFVDIGQYIGNGSIYHEK